MARSDRPVEDEVIMTAGRLRARADLSRRCPRCGGRVRVREQWKDGEIWRCRRCSYATFLWWGGDE